MSSPIMTPRAVNKVIPPSTSDEDLEANHREDTVERYESTILPASAIDFDPEPHKRLFRQFANPAPLGLCAFALTTFLLSLISVQARSVTVPNVLLGVALAYGGLAQFMAGMWEFACGNTFGALVFSSFGGFWISFAAIFIPWFNIAGAAGYANDPSMFANAIGHYLICWSIFAALLTVATLRSSVAFFGLFFVITLAFVMLAVGYYLGENVAFIKAGGYLGLVGAILAWYNGFAGVWNKSNSWIQLPLGQFPWAVKGRLHVGHKISRNNKNH